MNRLSLSLVLAMAIFGAGQTAFGATVTNIDLSSYYEGTWDTNVDGVASINGAAIAAGLQTGTGNTGSGLTFSDPTAGAVNIKSFDDPLVIGGLSIGLSSNSVVNSLMNNFFGDAGGTLEATLIFTNSDGATATYSIMEGAQIRDYNDSSFENTISSAVNWWNTGDTTADGQHSQRLDAQTFILPTSWDGTNLVSISIANPLGNVGQVVLSAIQVEDFGDATTAAPEPSSFLLVVAGPAALVLMRLKRRAV